MNIKVNTLPQAMQIPVETWLSPLVSGLSGDLECLLLFGPGVFSETWPPQDELGVLLVTGRVEPEILDRIRAGWSVPKGLLVDPPLVMTREEIRSSLDSYPIELLRMARTGVVVAGELSLGDLEPEMSDLRLQCERELRGLLIHARMVFHQVSGKDSEAGLSLQMGITRLVPVLRAMAVLGGNGHGRERPEEIVSKAAALAPQGRILIELAELRKTRKPRFTREQIILLMEWLETAIGTIDSWTGSKGVGI